MGVPGERMTKQSYTTLSWNQSPVKFKAVRRFRRWYIGSKEEVVSGRTMNTPQSPLMLTFIYYDIMFH